MVIFALGYACLGSEDIGGKGCLVTGLLGI